ncbi:MAG: J domain-containing protein [Pyrinomonadaceae bacterium]
MRLVFTGTLIHKTGGRTMRQSDAGKDFYSILGADEDASQDEIDRLYKRLAVRHHPDRGGDEEEMKSINEAYGVLRDAASRGAYDSTLRRRRAGAGDAAPQWQPSSSPAAQADAVGGRMVGAVLFVFLGLALLMLVRFHYITFLWPLALLAVFMVFVGVLMAHAALGFARESFGPTHPARRFVWAQEAVFWSAVVGGVYGVYLVMSAI